MNEKIFSLLFPVINFLMLYLYDKEKIINIKEEIVKTKKIKNSEMIDILSIYIVVTIIHIILLFTKNKYSLIGIGIIWLLFMIIYDFFKFKNINSEDSEKINIFSLNIQSKYQKGIKSELKLDSLMIFKIIYFVLALLLLNTESSATNILILFSMGILFQLINSSIIYFLNTKISIIPSVFVYINELIDNGPDNSKRNIIDRVLGYSKFAFMLIISLLIGLKFSINKSTIIKIITTFGIFTTIIFSWILLLGDRSILQRTYDKYNGKGYSHQNHLVPYFIPYILNAQGGLIINILLIFLSLIIKSFNGD